MKPAYSANHTRSSLAVVLLIALAAALVAVLVGLSDKPRVDAIGITAGQLPDNAATELTAAPAAEDTGVPNPAPEGVELDEAGNPILDDDAAVIQIPTEPAAAAITDSGTEAQVPATAEPLPTASTEQATPAPTPEVAPAVEPTPVPDDELPTEAADEDLGPDPSAGLSPIAGAVQGAFFTNADEENGAIVSTNTITMAFNEDGTGTFTGMLDITYDGGDRAVIDMSGPIRWSTGDPQIEANLAGTYTLDATIAADDVSSEEAKLTVSSLRSGVGSLCTPKCFGITFTPPQGL